MVKSHRVGGGRSSVNPFALVLIVAVGVVVIFLQIQWISNNQVECTGVDLRKYRSIIKAQTIRIGCQRCEGSGIVRDGKSSEGLLICSLCYGLGMHQARQLDDNDVICPTCVGLGRILDEGTGDGVDCHACGSRGLIKHDLKRFQIHATRVLCPHCEGRGVLRDAQDRVKLLICDVCLGLGSHLMRTLDGQDHLCASCEGMGRMIDAENARARACKLCKGRGLTIL